MERIKKVILGMDYKKGFDECFKNTEHIDIRNLRKGKNGGLNKLLFELYTQKKLSLENISKILNVNSETVRRWLIRFNIQRRFQRIIPYIYRHSPKTIKTMSEKSILRFKQNPSLRKSGKLNPFYGKKHNKTTIKRLKESSMERNKVNLKNSRYAERKFLEWCKENNYQYLRLGILDFLAYDEKHQFIVEVKYTERKKAFYLNKNQEKAQKVLSRVIPVKIFCCNKSDEWWEE